jgi:hypothetical protein
MKMSAIELLRHTIKCWMSQPGWPEPIKENHEKRKIECLVDFLIKITPIFISSAPLQPQKSPPKKNVYTFFPGVHAFFSSVYTSVPLSPFWRRNFVGYFNSVTFNQKTEVL